MVSMWVVLDIVCDVKVGSVRECLWCQWGSVRCCL